MSAPYRKIESAATDDSPIVTERPRLPAPWIMVAMGLVFIVIGMADCAESHGPIVAKVRTAVTIVGVLLVLGAIKRRIVE